MTRLRGLGVAAGLVAFLAAHAAEAAAWTTWFGGQYAPWFLNSGRAAAFTAGCVLVVSALFGAVERPGRPIDAVLTGTSVAAGAAISMIFVLFAWIGPGTIFPIVLAFGLLILESAAVAGAVLGRLASTIATGRRGRTA